MKSAAQRILISAILTFSVFADVMAGEPEFADTTSFVLVKSSHGIVLYERWYPITPDMRAREIKASFRIRATPEAAVALMKDASKGQRWNKNTCSYKVVNDADNQWVSYIQYDLPWPVSNQDCVLQYEQIHASDTVSIIFKGIKHPLFPESKRIQRIQELNGKWVFVKKDDEYHVEYYISTTPSKTLPGWMTDPIIRNNLLDTMYAFRKTLEGH